jgi:uncharacterized coiled-coil protein SlyX
LKDYVTIEIFNISIGNLNDLLTETAADLADRINTLEGRMTWQEMIIENE